jgi:ABC-type dipeptide/oligopeptide/nickel transport system ATPase component
MASLLEIEDLHTEIRLRSATVHALEGVSLSVEAGECLGIVGESGCGKTMTALSIMQLLAAASRSPGRTSPRSTTTGCGTSGATRSG